MDSIIRIAGRRRRWGGLLLGVLCAAGLVTGVNAGSDRWSELKPIYFGDREIIADDDVITLEAPGRAYDAAIVPIVIRAVNPGRRIRQVHLIVDRNPLPLAGVFRISEQAGDWESLETRIRINEYTDVRAIAELADGTLHMTSRFVKASGGCSAPAMADMELAMTRAGNMQLRLGAPEQDGGSSAEAVIKISHPNNSGMQFDQISRTYIPPFFVQSIAAELNGRKLLDIETNFSLSENPVVRLNFSPVFDADQPTALIVYAEDSRGNRYEKSLELESGQLQQ